MVWRPARRISRRASALSTLGAKMRFRPTSHLNQRCRSLPPEKLQVIPDRLHRSAGTRYWTTRSPPPSFALRLACLRCNRRPQLYWRVRLRPQSGEDSRQFRKPGRGLHLRASARLRRSRASAAGALFQSIPPPDGPMQRFVLAQPVVNGFAESQIEVPPFFLLEKTTHPPAVRATAERGR